MEILKGMSQKTLTKFRQCERDSRVSPQGNKAADMNGSYTATFPLNFLAGTFLDTDLLKLIF